MEKLLSCIDDNISTFGGAVCYSFPSHNQDGVHRVEEDIKLCERQILCSELK
jgi:hypothetical protein